MKLFKHALFILAGFLIIYILALIGSAYEHQTKFNQEVLDQTIASRNYDEWLSYQTHLFKHVDSFKSQNNKYQVDIYATIEHFAQSGYASKLYVFIIPMVDVNYAQSIRDNNDQMRFVFKSDAIVLLDSKKTYPNEALSFGLHPSKIGFVYQGIDLVKKEQLTIDIYDYDGDNIVHNTIDSTSLDELIYAYDPLQIDVYLNNYHYQQGKDSDDIGQILNPRIRSSIIFYVSIYFGLVIMGYSIYFIVQLIQTKTNKQ